MKAEKDVLVSAEPNDSRRLAERPGLADFCEVRREVGSRDCARRRCRYGIGQNPDKRAEPLAVERMALLAEQDGRMPADGVGPSKHVGDSVRVDAPDFPQVTLGGRSANRDELVDDAGDQPLDEGVALLGASGSGRRPQAGRRGRRMAAGKEAHSPSEIELSDMHDERDDVAALGAVAAVPGLLSAIDAESIGPAAAWARADTLVRGCSLEVGAEELGRRREIGVAGPRNEVGVDHAALPRPPHAGHGPEPFAPKPFEAGNIQPPGDLEDVGLTRPFNCGFARHRALP